MDLSRPKMVWIAPSGMPFFSRVLCACAVLQGVDPQVLFLLDFGFPQKGHDIGGPLG